MKYPSQPALFGQTILRSDVVLCAQSRRWGGHHSVHACLEQNSESGAGRLMYLQPRSLRRARSQERRSSLSSGVSGYA